MTSNEELELCSVEELERNLCVEQDESEDSADGMMIVSANGLMITSANGLMIT